MLENVRAQEPWLREQLEGLRERLPIVGDVRGAGFFWALELVRTSTAPASRPTSARRCCAAS